MTVGANTKVLRGSHPPINSLRAPQFGTEYRRDIQGIRAIAVLLVVLYHADVPLVSGGFIGVDVFFVLSGYLITGIMIGELNRTSTLRLSRFYAKRILRIVPAATLVIVVTLFMTYIWLPATHWKRIAWESAGSALYFSNWQFAATTDYLNSEAIPSPFQHFWSLSIEEQYYIVWPALFILVIVIVGFKRKKIIDLFSVRLSALLTIATIFCIASFIFSLYTMERWPAPSYFITPGRLWEIGVGSVLAFLVPSLRKLPNYGKRILVILGLLSVFGAAVTFSSSTVFPGVAALLPVIGTASIIAGGLPSQNQTRSYAVLGNPILVWIGNISYAWYLWHWPVILIPEVQFGPLSVTTKLALAVLSLILAALSTYYFEQPIRQQTFFKASVKRVYMLGAISVALSIGSAFWLVNSLPVQAPSQDSKTPLGAESIGENELPPSLSSIPKNLIPTVLEAGKDIPEISGNGCHLSVDEIIPEPCQYGAPLAPTVLLVGDSHAGQWFPALFELANKQNFNLVTMTKSSCPFTSVPLELSREGREYVECIGWNIEVQDYISKKQPALVVTSSLEAYTPFTHESGGDLTLSEGFQKSWQSVANQNIPLLVLADTPFMKENVPDCLSQHSDDVSRCRTDSQKAFASKGVLEKAVDGVKDAQFLDLNDKICPGEICEPIIGGTLVYRDQHHLTATFSKTLGPILSKRSGNLIPTVYQNK